MAKMSRIAGVDYRGVWERKPGGLGKRDGASG